MKKIIIIIIGVALFSCSKDADIEKCYKTTGFFNHINTSSVYVYYKDDNGREQRVLLTPEQVKTKLSSGYYCP